MKFDYPDLTNAKVISVDLETYDPYLTIDGPGWARGVGYVLGVALATEDWAGYLPLGDFPSQGDIDYLKQTLNNPCPKVGANLIYDYGWLAELGIFPKGQPLDIQFAEALLDDNLILPSGGKRSISLDSLAQEYLNMQKEDISKYAPTWVKDPREALKDMPLEIVAKYAIKDAQLPIKIMKIQEVSLRSEGLIDLFKMECQLIPLLVAMRCRGMPINELAAIDANENLKTAISILTTELSKHVGYKINVNSAQDIARLCDANGIEYTHTAKGNPSFTANFLKASNEPLLQQILELRQLKKLRTTFIENAILDKSINGKIYPSLHPLRSDEYGTCSGRFSSSQPNAQQIAKRSKLASIVRSIFCPEQGYTDYCSMDLSQIEYRLFAHFSNDEDLIKAYQDPKTDYHALVGEFVGGDLPRIAMKTLNFSMLYGMGKAKLSASLAALFPDETNPTAKALSLYNIYNKKFPAAQKLLKYYADKVAQPPHEVSTLLGRKARFVKWESTTEQSSSYPLGIAINKFGGNIRIAGAYKAINRVIQGSAADLMKKAMLDCYQQGLFKNTGVPHMTIHDEICFSYHSDLHKDFLAIKECTENCIQLKVPVLMGLATGPNWAQVKNVL